MSDRVDKVQAMCDEALSRIDSALAMPSGPSSLTTPMLRQIRSEVAEMKEALDPKVFSPGYGRPLLDWPASDELIDLLIELKYQYDRLSHRRR